MLERLLEKFGSALDTATFIALVAKVEAIGEADKFLEIAKGIIHRLPSVDTAVLLLHAATVLRTAADDTRFKNFVAVTRVFIDQADPLLVAFWQILFHDADL
jgi:hypothetical protein